jgi:serine/threonine-protein kinase
MGFVFRALDERLSRIVAIKVLAPALAASTLARCRFEREARAAAAVCHEHVVTIHAVDEAAGYPYLVMQFVSGQSLQEKLDKGGAIGTKEVLRIGMQVASGLAAAHTQGLIHRDIKPANLLLENGVERVKITDFGLARAIDDASITDSGMILGTPHYMSPEQARGEAVDHRSDLFSLGSVLFAMCTGQPPFRAESTVAVLRKVSDDVPRSVRELNPDVPDWLEAIVVRLMSKDPAARFQSAGEVAELLARRLAQVQHPAAPPPRQPAPTHAPGSPSRPLARPLALSAGAVVLLTAAVGGWVRLHPHARHPVPVERTAAADPPAPPPPPAPAATPTPAPAAVSVDARNKALDFIEVGDVATRRGDVKKAIEYYTEALAQDPTSTRALVARAHLNNDYRIRDFKSAIVDTTEALRLDPKNAEAYEERAYSAYSSGDLRRAVGDASEAILLDPGRIWAYSHRGAAYRELGEWKHAVIDLTEFLAKKPDVSWSLLNRALAYQGLGDDDRALADADRAIKLGPKVNHFRTLRAQLLARKKDYDRARAEYAEAIRVSSDAEKFFVYQRRGDFEVSISEFETAIADYTETIKRNRDMAQTKDVSAYVARAQVYLMWGRTDEAIADCNAAVRIDPSAKWMYNTRGFALARKAVWDRAVADFDEEARRQPLGEWSWPTARACVLAMAGRYEQASKAFDEANKLAGGLARGVLASRAYYFDRPQGHYVEAIKNLNAAADPVWPPVAYLYRGFLLARLGQPDQALADFKKLMEIVESHRGDLFMVRDFMTRRLVFLLGRGEAYLQKGDLEHALADADGAVRFLPTSAEAHALRARIHEKRAKADVAAADRAAAARLVSDPILATPGLEGKRAAASAPH